MEMLLLLFSNHSTVINKAHLQASAREEPPAPQKGKRRKEPPVPLSPFNKVIEREFRSCAIAQRLERPRQEEHSQKTAPMKPLPPRLSTLSEINAP